jgi:hypothetical protein
MADRNLFNQLRASLDRIPVIDTHEQMGRWEYVPCLGIEQMLRRLMPHEAAGLRRRKPFTRSEVEGPPTPPQDSTYANSVSALLSRTKNTPLYRYALATFADLFECHSMEINEANWRFLSDQIVRRTADPRWPREVLREKANIEVALTSQTALMPQASRWAGGMFVPLFTVDHLLLLPAFARGRRALEQRYNVTLNNLNDLLTLIEKIIKTAAQNGFAGLRTRLASFRTLHIENVAPSSVQGIFEKASGPEPRRRDAAGPEQFDPAQRPEPVEGHGRRGGVTTEEAKRLQDFVFHAIVQCAIMNKLPIQIDAGLGGAGASTFDRANPLHLTDMIFNYADARFAILHGGFPFTGETAVMAKTFPNIYLDGSLLRQTSPSMAKTVLHEWLEVVPCGKMMIWGGNSRSPEAAYASLLMAKDIVAEVLAEKVESGYFNETLAVDIAWKLFRENAKSFYNLNHCHPMSAQGATSAQ